MAREPRPLRENVRAPQVPIEPNGLEPGPRVAGRDPTSDPRRIRAGRAEWADPRPVGSLVFRWSPAPDRGPPRRPLRRVRASAPQPPYALLLPPLQMDVPRALLLGLRSFVYDAEGPLHVSTLRGSTTGARARRRPHRRDRARRTRPRVFQPSDRLSRVSRAKDA